jgi:hypothetical protein
LEEKKTGRRGRPKKSAVETPAAVEETAVPAVEETVSEASAAVETTPVSEEKTEAVKEPAKRGRRKKTETAAAEVTTEEVKEPAKRGRKKKAETSISGVKLTIQYDGYEFEEKTIIEKIEEKWRAEGNKAGIESLEIYVKPEERKIYYVVNGLSGSLDFF